MVKERLLVDVLGQDSAPFSALERTTEIETVAVRISLGCGQSSGYLKKLTRHRLGQLVSNSQYSLETSYLLYQLPLHCRPKGLDCAPSRETHLPS